MNFELQLPYYLTDDKKQALRKALAKFPNFQYFSPGDPEEVLQGDIWSGFHLINFNSLQKRAIKGIVISNSCDVSAENLRDAPTNITFAPIIPLQAYVERYVIPGSDKSRVNDKLNAIRKQEVTNIFYLPAAQHFDEEHLVLLDRVQSMPIEAFNLDDHRQKFISLTNAGFYLFLFKLSFHFCRFHEEVDRG